MAHTPRRGPARRLLVALGLVALNLVVLEVAARAWFAVRLGPRVLAYGTPWHRLQSGGGDPKDDNWKWSVQSHHNDVGQYRAYKPAAVGYSKYFPGETKFTESPDRKERWPVRINNHGFRGADFELAKPPGTIRILTLGASSTFGYHDRDDETYPYLLGQELQRLAAPGQRVEVINFAIPHAMTDNVLAMLLAEGFALQPDLVTFYEGANDAAVIEPRSGVAPDRTLRERLAERSVLVALYDSLVPRAGAQEIDVAWWWSDELAARRSVHFNGNLRRLVEECRARGIGVVLATQQFQSTLIPAAERRGVSYEAELAMVRDRVARGEIGPGAPGLSAAGRYRKASDLVFEVRAKGGEPGVVREFQAFEPPRAMLMHARLMADLRAWAPSAGSDVGFVDVVHELDGGRDHLVNWVHLDGQANAVIARALAREIAPRLGIGGNRVAAAGGPSAAAPSPAPPPEPAASGAPLASPSPAG